MTSAPEKPHYRKARWKKLSIACALIVLITGLVGMAGWAFDVEALKRIHPSLVTMKVNTAICLILAACALLLLQSEPVSIPRRLLAVLFGLSVTAIGVATLIEHFRGIDLGIDQFLFQESVASAGLSFPGRMGVAGAINFSLLGATLVFIDLKLFGRFWPAHWCVLGAASATSLVFLYYFYGVGHMEPFAMYATIALHTAVALLLLAAGIFLTRPDRGFAAALLGDNLGGVVARRMLPALGVIIVLGWLRNLGREVGLYGAGFGTAAFVMLIVLLFAGLIWWTSSWLNHTEARRLEAQRLLKHRSAQFETLLNQAPLGVYLVDADFRIRNVNPMAQAVFGDIPDLIGRDFDEVQHLLWEKDYADEVVRLFRHTLETGVPYATPERVEHRLDRNTPEYYEWRIDRIRTPDGRYGVVCYFRDVSTQVKARAVVAESEERFRSLVSILTDVPWTADANGAFVSPQESWAKYTGQTWEESQGFGWTQAIHPDDRNTVTRSWDEACRNRSLYQGHGRIWHAATKQWRYFESRATPLLNPDGTVHEWVGTCTDIHDRKTAEEALRQSQKQLEEELADSQLLQSISAEIIREENVETLYERLVDAAVGIMRSQFASIQMLVDNGSSLGELHLLAYRGFNAEAASFWKRVDIESKCVCGEALRIHQRVIISDVTKSDFMTGSDHLATYLQTGIAAVQTTPLISRSGKIVGMISTHWDHPHEPSVRDLRLFDILARQAADLLERKHAVDALRATQEQLLQHTADLEKVVSERTARLSETVHELESFSYSITHDLRTPLRAMQSFADILCEEHTEKLDEAAKSYLRRINTSARRMDKLIEDVLVYSRVLRMDLKLEPVDVNKLLHGMLESYPHLQEPAADVNIEGELPPALGNEAALTQCFSNLLGNAIKFVAPGTKPRVRISAEQSGYKVRFWIADNGIGIDQRHAGRVFDTFQRLSTAYEGTGIGLTIVRKAVERLGGAVGVESEPGKGSRFWLDLSAVPEQNQPSYESSNGALCGR